jgi:hypothetical protein
MATTVNKAGMLAAISNGWPTYLTLYGTRSGGKSEPLWRVKLADCNPTESKGMLTYHVPVLVADESVTITGAWMEGKNGNNFVKMMEFDLGLTHPSMVNGSTLRLDNVTIKVD